MRLERGRALRLSVYTSLAGKGLTALVQLYAMPKLAGALGLTGYGAYVALIAFHFIANGLSSAFSTGLALRLASGGRMDERATQRDILAAVVLSGGVAGIVFAALGFLYATDLLAAARTDRSIELAVGTAVLLLLSLGLLTALLQPAEAIFTGLQKQYIVNVGYLFGAAGSLLLLQWAAQRESLAACVLAIVGPIFCVRLVLALMALRLASRGARPPGEAAPLLQRDHLQSFVQVCSAYLVVQLGAVSIQQLSVVIIGQSVALEQAAKAAVLLQVLALVGTALTLVTQPLLPAIRAASSAQDSQWLLQVGRALSWRCGLYLALCAVALLLFGSDILSYLVGSEVTLTVWLRMAWAWLLLALTVEHILYVWITGIGRDWQASRIFACGCLLSIAAFCGAAWLGLGFGAVFGLALGPTVLTIPLYIRLLRP